MRTELACDISYYQEPVDDSYPHRWLIFRWCDGTFHDPNRDANLRWSRAALANGRLLGYTVYVVFRPGQNSAILADLAGLPTEAYVMVDAEDFGGEIKGDHSAEINALCESMARRFGRSKVWAYGNRGPDLEVWPRKPSWIGWVVASYGGSKPTGVPNLIGWQYTDGTYGVPGLPSSTPPFGNCDHNVLYLPDSAGDDMSAADVAEIKAYIDATVPKIAREVFEHTYLRDGEFDGPDPVNPANPKLALKSIVKLLLNWANAARLNSAAALAAAKSAQAAATAAQTAAANAAKALTSTDPAAPGLLVRQASVQAEVAALRKQVAAIPGTGPVDLAAVSEAARDGARSGASLDGAALTIRQTTGGAA